MNSRVSTKILYERRRKPPNSEHTFENLDHFLSDLDGVITRNKEGTSNNLTVFDAVKGMVQKILDVVGTMDPVMKPGRLNPVGSFKEGTKLGNPNEFDFVVEMECFEHSKTLLVKDECNIAGAIHLILSDTTQTTPTQTTMGQLVSEIEHAHGNCKYLSPVRFRNYFWQLVTAVATHLSQQNCTIRNEAGKLEITKDVPQHLDVYDKGPNIEVFMVWTSADETEKFGISVDVTPALRLREVVPEAAGVALNRVQCVQYQDNSGNSVSNVC